MPEATCQKGILVRGVGGLYGVRPLPLSGGGTVLPCRARGAFRHQKLTPLVGDLVHYSPSEQKSDTEKGDNAQYVIDEILPRKNELIRPPLANLTHLFLMIPAARPAPDLRTADMLLAIAETYEIETTVLISKSDLAPAFAAELCESYTQAGYTVLLLDAEKPDTVAALRAHILAQMQKTEVMTAAFIGASGVGKSTMLTRLFPTLSLKTGDVSRKTERGRQTTRHSELFSAEIDGQFCLIADTPGFSMLDFTQCHALETECLAESFREFAPHLGLCRYTKCTHTREEGCAILAAIKRGEIARFRHESYLAMFEECKKNPSWKRRREGRP